MTLAVPDNKSGILLSPDRILSDQMILEAVHFAKILGVVNYRTNDLDTSELTQYYPHLSAQAKTALLQFSIKAVGAVKEEIRKRFALQKAGIPYDAYYKKAIIRRLNEQLESLRPFYGTVNWYHKLQVDKGRFTIGACEIRSNKPGLQFEVSRQEQKLGVDTIINLDGKLYPLSRFRRYQFILQNNSEYCFLSYKDYQTVEWLEAQDPEVYDEPSEFARILSKLESDHYPVNRKNLPSQNEIISVPDNRIMLSEISKSFLVLTPQWIYDGFLIEGAWKESVEIIRNGESYVIRRDREAETAFLKIVESLHQNFPKQLNGSYYLSFADAQKKQWFLKVYHQLLARNIELAGMDMLEHFRYSPHKIATESGIEKEEGNTVTLKMKVSFGEEEVSLTELQKIARAGQRSVLLKDGSLGILNEDWFRRYGAIIRHGKISHNIIEVEKWFAFSEQEADGDTSVIKGILTETWWQKWQRWQDGAGDICPVPSLIKATLRPYQQKGFEWMVLLAEAGAGAYLADDMGLGKTLQTICFLAHQLEVLPATRHLIVCPSSLIYNWQEELHKFAPHISSFVYHGGNRNTADLQNSSYQVIISSYGTVRADIEEFIQVNFGVVVLDESHTIKNPDALTTRAVTRLPALTRIALSGTPVMNNSFDLYAQLNFLLPGMLGSREFFNREYANSIDREHNQDKIMALRKLIAPFILRRTKEQVAGDLPPKTEMVMWCTMKPSQKDMYEDIKAQIRDSLFLQIKSEGLNRARLAILQGMLKLRQICNSPLLFPAEEQTCTDSVKTDLLMNELANNLKDHKVLVFSQFTGMLNILARACTDQGIAYYHFDGQTPPLKRAEMVAQFQQEGNKTNVFLISLKAGNTGLNLTAAAYVFLFDPWWNAATEQQAIDRTHRIGQGKNVFAYKLICKDTIEERILEMQQRKKQLSADLVSEDEGFVKSLTQEDIDYLFS